MSKGKDRHGRWSKVSLEGKNGYSTTIYTAYRVGNNRLETAGGETIWAQEYQSLMESGIDDPAPRRQMLDDLASEIGERTEKENIIVCMDANESMSNPGRNDLRSWAEETGMIDIHNWKHEESQETPTHGRGSKQIDYIFVSEGIVSRVQRAGILPIDFVLPSDHRTLYIDIDMSQILQGKRGNEVPTTRKILRLNDVKALEKFQQRQWELATEHKIEENILKIAKVLMEMKNEKEKQIWRGLHNKLDIEMGDIMTAAQTQCSKKRPTITYLWFPKLPKAGRTVTYWKARKEAKKANIEIQGYPVTLEEELKIEREETQTLEDIKRKLNEAWKDLRKEQEGDRESRDEFLQDLANYMEEKRNMTAASALKQIKTIENTNAMHKKIDYFFKGSRRGAMTNVLVPTEDDKQGPYGKKWKELEDPEEIFEAILTYNSNHIKQSGSSPFADSSLAEDIGQYGETEEVDNILQGMYDVGEDLMERRDSEILKLYIKSLIKHPRPKEDISGQITQNELEQIFKDTPERTSSSPSGLHMGLWKASFLHKELAALHTTMIALPFMFGYTLDRWQNSIHVMLQKEKHPYIHRLWIVQLFEADFNAALKILHSKRLMRHTETNKLNSEETFAARQGHTPHDALLNMQLTYEISSLRKAFMAMILTDMKSCFDRIRLNHMTITSRRLGMPKEAAIAHAQTLVGMTHRIRTGYAESTRSIKPDRKNGGVGQGSGAGTTLNHTQIETMLSVMKKITPGQLLQDPDEARRVLQHMIIFMDDACNKEDLSYTMSIREKLQHIRDVLISWRRTLRITRGELELRKTEVYLIDYFFIEGGTIGRMKNIQDIPGQIELEGDHDDERTTKITRKEIISAEKYLGIHVSPNGQMDSEHNRRVKESMSLTQALRRSPLTRGEAMMFYSSRWRPILRYYLPITYFTEEQCNRIQIPIYRDGIQQEYAAGVEIWT